MVGQQGERGDPPIATATVARLYMEQGRLEQAERLYQALLRQHPRERALVEGLAEVRRRIEEHIRGSSPLYEPVEKDYNERLCMNAFAIQRQLGGFDMNNLNRPGRRNNPNRWA